MCSWQTERGTVPNFRQVTRAYKRLARRDDYQSEKTYIVRFFRDYIIFPLGSKYLNRHARGPRIPFDTRGLHRFWWNYPNAAAPQSSEGGTVFLLVRAHRHPKSTRCGGRLEQSLVNLQCYPRRLHTGRAIAHAASSQLQLVQLPSRLQPRFVSPIFHPLFHFPPAVASLEESDLRYHNSQTPCNRIARQSGFPFPQWHTPSLLQEDPQGHLLHNQVIFKQILGVQAMSLLTLNPKSEYNSKTMPALV